MKNYMKKIIVGLFAFAFLFIGHSAFAAVSSGVWNGDSGDCATISIANADKSEVGDPCWTETSVSAQPG